MSSSHLNMLRDIEVLRELASFKKQYLQYKEQGFKEWARPMDVGGSNGSHHSYTLAKLARRGFADQQSWRIGIRHTNLYRINEQGEKELQHHASK